MKPVAVPGRVWRASRDALKLLDRGGRAALDEHALGPELPFEKHDRAGAVAPDPVLALAVGAAAMEHVERGGLEIQTRRFELVVLGPGAELVGGQVRPHPGLNL